MTSSDAANDGLWRVFLVERYLSPAAADGLISATARVSRLCSDPPTTTGEVRYLYSAYLPSEDTCFCLFRAMSSDAVRAVNAQAEFPLERITDAELLVCADHTSPTNQTTATEFARPTSPRRST
jgi:hypothetical protein